MLVTMQSAIVSVPATAWGAASVGAAAAGAAYYNGYYNNNCYYDSYGQYVCPNQYQY
jgi:hypothetical protein